MKPALRVLAGAAPATVQDQGRRGCQGYGVPRSGAMDQFALAAANRLVGNRAGAAAIEVTAGGAAFEALDLLVVAVAGGELGAMVDDEPLPGWTSAVLAPGARLRFAGRSGSGARAYLAVNGGIAVPRLLGSCSTYLPGAWGGFEGRPLRAGDVLRVLAASGDLSRLAGRQWKAQARPPYTPQPVLRLVPGPHDELTGGLHWLLERAFVVAGASSRIGYRLEGPRSPHGVTLPSFGVVPGALQVPSDGGPILLMADAQPTGGYPVAGVVAAADLPLAAQLLPGDSLRFRECDVAEARAAWHEQLQALETGVEDDPVLRLLSWAGG